MRIVYIIICSALFLASMLSLRWMLTAWSDQFLYGAGFGGVLFFFIGYYAGMTDQKRKATDDL